MPYAVYINLKLPISESDCSELFRKGRFTYITICHAWRAGRTHNKLLPTVISLVYSLLTDEARKDTEILPI